MSVVTHNGLYGIYAPDGAEWRMGLMGCPKDEQNVPPETESVRQERD